MMKLIMNPNIENIELDDLITLFDPETKDTHVIDENGKEILDLCKEMSVEDTIQTLIAKYDETDGEIIKNDIMEFLNELVEKGLAKFE
jgi:hypothetical protein